LLLLVVAAAATVAAPTYGKTEVFASWTGFERQYAIGAIPQCQGLFNILSAGELFMCHQKDLNGTMLATAAVDTLGFTLDSANSNQTYQCKAATVSGEIGLFSLIPDDIGQSCVTTDPAFFGVSTSAACILLQLAIPTSQQKLPAPLPAPNTGGYAQTYASASRNLQARQSFAMEPIGQCTSFFNYLSDQRQVVTCINSDTTDTGTRMYFSVANNILGLSMKDENSVTVTCSDKAKGKQVNLAPSIVRLVAQGTERGNKQSFIQGMNAACVILAGLAP
jgi:hypothetical protein